MASVAESISRLTTFFHKRQITSVLDYGAGTLRNAAFLADRGFRVYAADIPEQVENILKRSASAKLAGVLRTDDLDAAHLDVDLVLSTYVLNIIPDGTQKSRYIRNIVLNLKPDGYLLIEVRCRIESPECGSGCSSALHKCSRCVKTFSHQELDALLNPYGFRRLSHYYRRHALAVLYRLTNC